MLLWNEQFATGSRELDFQHQTLIDNINELETLLALPSPLPRDCDAMLSIVSFLERYAEKHFACEEHCMEYFRCPCRDQNQTAHNNFLKLFRPLKNRPTAEAFPRELVHSLHAAVKEWIEGHMLKVDSQLKPFIKGSHQETETSFLRLG
jgi:hemerythrin-like metal-binding protein